LKGIPLSTEFYVLSQFRLPKKHITALLIHMNISTYGVTWSRRHGCEAKLLGKYFYIYAQTSSKILTWPTWSEIRL